jgi:N6-L-threonylcarbamoyladenine synthase
MCFDVHYRVEFPYLCLLISGGHCLLAVVQGVDEFVLIGSSIDIAPGDALDKVARRLKLNNLPECAGKSGGHAIETLALQGSYSAFEPVYVMNKLPDCNFSFSGIQNTWERRIIEEEARIGNCMICCLLLLYMYETTVHVVFIIFLLCS